MSQSTDQEPKSHSTDQPPNSSNSDWNKHLGSDLTFSVINMNAEDKTKIEQMIHKKVKEGIKQEMAKVVQDITQMVDR